MNMLPAPEPPTISSQSIWFTWLEYCLPPQLMPAATDIRLLQESDYDSKTPTPAQQDTIRQTTIQL